MIIPFMMLMTFFSVCLFFIGWLNRNFHHETEILMNNFYLAWSQLNEKRS